MTARPPCGRMPTTFEPAMKIAIILGTRPEIIRLSCIIERLDQLCDVHLAHTGQNYEHTLSDVFFQELGVRAPDSYLGIAGGKFSDRVGAILAAAQRTFEAERPDRLLVLGDTDSALSAFVAKRMGIPVLHMEAGNRCFDDRVPEEVNRRVIDGCSDLLMPYTERSRENLLREGFPSNRVLVIGNPIKEVLDRHADRFDASTIHADLGLEPRGYLLLTLHRQETVDHPDLLRVTMTSIEAAAESLGLPIVFSLHPRTRDRLHKLGLIPEKPLWRLCEPFGYFDFVALHARGPLRADRQRDRSGGVRDPPGADGHPSRRDRTSGDPGMRKQCAGGYRQRWARDAHRGRLHGLHGLRRATRIHGPVRQLDRRQAHARSAPSGHVYRY